MRDNVLQETLTINDRNEVKEFKCYVMYTYKNDKAIFFFKIFVLHEDKIDLPVEKLETIKKKKL